MELKELPFLKHILSKKGGLFPTSKRDWNKKSKKIQSWRFCFKTLRWFLFSIQNPLTSVPVSINRLWKTPWSVKPSWTAKRDPFVFVCLLVCLLNLAFYSPVICRLYVRQWQVSQTAEYKLWGKKFYSATTDISYMYISQTVFIWPVSVSWREREIERERERER